MKSGVVDDTVNLGGGRVFLFSGVDDDTVNQPVMNGLRDYYENFIGFFCFVLFVWLFVLFCFLC